MVLELVVRELQENNKHINNALEHTSTPISITFNEENLDVFLIVWWIGTNAWWLWFFFEFWRWYMHVNMLDVEIKNKNKQFDKYFPFYE